MRFYFDESGDFGRHDNQRSIFGVVASVVFPEAIAPDVEHAYKTFVAGLSQEERKHGEPKGSLLSTDSRSLFAGFLAAFPDLLSYVVILDLSATQQDMYDYLPQGLRDTLDQQAKHLIHAEMRDRIELLGKQVANLSSSQFAHLFTVGQAVLGAFNKTVLHFFEPEQGYHFESLKFEIDKVANRQEIVFDILIRQWIETWTFYDPITLVEEVHVPGHPLIDNYTVDGQLSAKKIICDNLSFVDSRSSPGVQMADILSNTFYVAITRQDDESIRTIAEIVRRAHRFPWACLRLFTFGERAQKIHNPHLQNVISRIEEIIGIKYIPGGLPPYPGDTAQ